MKKLMLATTSLLSLSVITASAADLAPRYAKVAPMPSSAFSWTGCYVGVHAGGGGMHDSFTGEFGAGALAGAQGGCNYQTGMLVVGIEGEGWWSGIKSDLNRTTDSEGFFTNDRTSNKYDYSIAGRAGVAFDRALVYLKGGWVWGRFDFYDRQGCDFCTTVISTASQTLNGPLIGVGVEYAFTNNWTAKVEYNYANYGSRMIRLTCQSGCSSAFGQASSEGAEKHIVKIGVNYLFNSTSSGLAQN